jgi:propanediol dehydratase large subunit
MMRSKRFQVLSERAVNKDGFIKEWPEVGLIAMDGPNDPTPSIKIQNGKIVELDGKKREDFDLIDTFIAEYGIELERAEEVMAIPSVKLANMLCDVNVPRTELVQLTTSMTPAKAAEVLNQMNVLEMMMALTKMRPRKTPSNQCHVTNLKDHPVQLAADSAEASLRGFDEHETTVGVVRYAPFNALSLLVGSQVGRPGILTQCAVEEAT